MPLRTAVAAALYWLPVLVTLVAFVLPPPSRALPVWSQAHTAADEAALIARLREEWFLPLSAKGVSVREGSVSQCGTHIRVAKYPKSDKHEVGDFFESNFMVEKEATDRYELIRVLGKGTQGVVVLSRDKVSGELVAIKKADAREIAKEVGLLQAVQGSEDIMKIKNVLKPRNPETIGHAFVVYERLALPIDEVSKLWGGHAKTPKSTIKRMLFNVVRGLNFLHINSIVHLDIKHDNIMTTQDCDVRIVDMGQARYMYRPNGKVRELPGGAMRHGSHPPEFAFKTQEELKQEIGGPAMAKASDMWSLGYVILTVLHGGGDPLQHFTTISYNKYKYRLDALGGMLGRPPMEIVNKYYSKAAKNMFVGHKVPKEPPIPIEVVFPHIEHQALAMVKRMMDMDPSARPNTTEILLDPFFKEIRKASYHEKALAEELEPDPRIPELLASKGLGTTQDRNSARSIIYELSLAYSQAVQSHQQETLRNESLK